MDFLTWHYTYGVRFYLMRFRNAILSINHQLSLPLLLPTLFAPWKRLAVSSNRKGLHLLSDFRDMTFNLISRLIGAVVRLFVLIFGVTAILLMAVFGLVGFGLWLFIPVLSYSLYSVYKRQPEFVLENFIRGRSEFDSSELWNSSQGGFLLTHLGNDQIKLAFPQTLKLTQKHPKTFFEFMKDVCASNAVDESKLRAAQVTVDELLLCASWWDERRTKNTTLDAAPVFSRPGVGMSLLFGYTPTLDKYVTDMGEHQSFSHHLIARSDVVSRMVRVLTTGRGIMLTGVPGVGKKTVVYEFAKKASEGLLGKEMSYKRILDFDYNALMATSGDLNTKKVLLSQILEEAASAGNVILVIRDIFRLTNSEVEGVDFTDVITHALENHKLFIISLVDKADYTKYVSRNARLSKYFEEVQIVEMSKEDANHVLLSAARFSEKQRNIITPVPVLVDIVASSEQYLTDTPFPEKALELLDSVLLYHAAHNATGVVTKQEVRDVLSEKTGIALSSLGDSQKMKLTHLEEQIHERLVNQTYPVSLIAKALRAKTSGVVSSARPIGSFLFLGPTGVGKTETAKALADVYFGNEKKIIRFDMSEFVGGEGVERLIGNASKGTPGILTTALKNSPASLLLLDEIEKAPSSVFNLFLSLLDEGRITDAFGTSVSATHTFIIATSNAGSEYIRQLVTDHIEKEALQQKVIDHVLSERVFTPEFINRFDGVVVYEPLSMEQLKEVSKKLLLKLSLDMKAKGIIIDFDDSVYQKVVEEGYDPALGARPMRRMIELKLGDVIASGLLASEIKEGDHIVVSVNGETHDFAWEKK